MAETLKFATELSTATFEAGMARVKSAGQAAAQSVHSSFSTALGSLTGPIAAIGSAVAAAFATKNVISGVANVFAAGRALSQLSRETGASVQGLVILQSKFKQAGLDGEEAGTAILKLQKTIGGIDDESGKGIEALQKLGLNMDRLKKLSPENQFLAVGRAIAAVQNPAERTADTMAIFGREGGRLVGVFREADFGTVGKGLQQKAEMMAKNAAIFEAVSIKLEKVGNITKTFYAGVAERVVTTLAPILDRLEKINLVQIGQRFGDGIAHGAQMFIGAFSHPELVASTLENGLAAGVLGMGNVLIATLKAGGEFFKDGLLDSLQGIGSAIVATLMEAFDKPIRYLQAGIEAALQTAQYIADKASGKQDDTSGLGSMSDAERAEHTKKWQGVRDNRFEQLAKQNGLDLDTNDGVTKTASLATKDASYTNANREYLAARQYDPSKYARTPQSMEEIMVGHANDPTRFGLYGGGQTAADWRQQAKEQGSAGWQGATSAVRGFHVDDVFGAGDYAQRATASGNRLAAVGRQVLGPASTNAGTGTAAGSPAGAASDPISDGMMANIKMAAAQSGISTKGMDRKTLVGMGSSLMYLGPNGPNGGMDAAGNANDPYTQRVDAQRKRDQFLAHTVGGGTALDFDPSQQKGWTGAKNAVTRGGVGINAAYGRTGNIMTQVSGRVGGGNKDHAEETAKNTKGLLDAFNSAWKGGGSGGGGGGATATR